MEPKPLTIDLVGKKCAIPHAVMTREPRSTNTYLRIIIIPSFDGLIGNNKNVFKFVPSSQ
jgi:hypothetical protein